MAEPSSTSSAPATAGGNEVDAHALRAWLLESRATLYDVREPDEHARERIPGAALIPLSRFASPALSDGVNIVFHCKSGKRSAEAVRLTLASASAAGRNLHGRVYSLRGGIEEWKRTGGDVEHASLTTDRRAPGTGEKATVVPSGTISVMRQVQLVIGVGVATGTALGAFVSLWWLILPAFFGAGLIVAGATGTCGLASILSHMPWNRIKGGSI